MMWFTLTLLILTSLVNAVLGAFARVPGLSEQQEPPALENPFTAINQSETLIWVPCYADTAAAKLGALECARLIVPLDYTNLSNGNAILAIIRLRSNDTQVKPMPPVFYNPGGPGYAPIRTFTSIAESLRVYVGNGRDIITIDPRAAGSTFPPAACFASNELREMTGQRITEVLVGSTNVSLNVLDASAEGLGLDCSLISGHILPYMGTVNTARDIKHVAEALNEQKFAFFGTSYGTILGATLASLFPEDVERMVLDGVLDSNAWYSIESEVHDPTLVVGDTDDALQSFFDSCFVVGEEKCALWSAGGPGEIKSRYDAVISKLRQRPAHVPKFGLLDYTLFRRYVLLAVLFSPEGSFARLAFATREIERGQPSQALAEYFSDGTTLGPSEAPLMDSDTRLSNGFEANYAIRCMDRPVWEAEVTEATLAALVDRWRSVSDLGGENYSMAEVFCQRFPISAKERITKRIRDVKTSCPILWVNPTRDPVTPLRNAYAMAEAFPGSVVLEVNGTGHTSANANTNLNCGRTYIMPYFTEGKLPTSGTVCDGEQDFFK